MKASTKYLKLLVNFLIIIIMIIFLVFVVPRIIWFFFPFVVGWILSVIANPLVKFLEKRVKLIRKHSSMLIIIGVLALIVIGGYFALAKLSGEIVSLLNNLPEIYENISNEFNEVGDNLQVIFNKLPKNFQQSILEARSEFTTYIGNVIGVVGAPTVEAAGNFAKNLPSRLISIIMTILSSYFFIADREKILVIVNQCTPYSIRKNVGAIILDFKRLVGGYFKAQFKIMTVVAVILLIGFYILHVDYSILLAILIAFLDFLPIFGTGTALIPWGIIKLLSADYKMAIGLFVIYGVSQLVRQLIQPKIVGDTIGLNPLLTLVFMYIGYKVKGVLGMIIAVPVGMILINLFLNGAFDHMIHIIKEILKDINDFRKID
ncbi:sporulation integral membrane protein YtvI [Lachnotalea glycerini]|uniref:Sporulation integral membrane protein YtvI n=1 Tax=Lachnotalea glycerini TaxID=1763509 RepID=A0A255I9B6_9FIRM|nr:sporulation integral membrane protein YtvI [Lachnotalea glycerini]PXV89096.1 sporulation integral membrane protein YtvI [Lachnotalea glycerini]RDY30513.1 sporulation integral membrane protein YtvI [Lachnotalea glycerini]